MFKILFLIKLFIYKQLFVNVKLILLFFSFKQSIFEL